MNLKIDSSADDVCHMSLSGRVTQTEMFNHQDQLTQLLGQAHFNRTILLSFQEANFIDSSGIGWLLSTDKKIRDAGGKLVLHSLPEEIQGVVMMMRLNRVLNIAKDKQSAQAGIKAVQ
jgi:anti-anti-sigma factor